MLHALDPDNEKNWGRLSPVTRPEDLRTIYLCPRHIHDLDYPYTATAQCLDASRPTVKRATHLCQQALDRNEGFHLGFGVGRVSPRADRAADLTRGRRL